jgi:hypothetical protein
MGDQHTYTTPQNWPLQGSRFFGVYSLWCIPVSCVIYTTITVRVRLRRAPLWLSLLFVVSIYHTGNRYAPMGTHQQKPAALEAPISGGGVHCICWPPTYDSSKVVQDFVHQLYVIAVVVLKCSKWNIVAFTFFPNQADCCRFVTANFVDLLELSLSRFKKVVC